MHAQRAAVLRRSHPAIDTSQRVLCANQLVKLRTPSPWIRNDNSTSSVKEIKIGPQAILKLPDGTYLMLAETIQNTGFTANNGMTAFLRLTATSLQGPWTESPAATLVLAAGDTSTWEYNEFSPAWARWDPTRSRIVVWCHGGNNDGPAGRQGGLAYSTDAMGGQSWVKDPSNPIIVPGASGAFDDKQAGGDIKFIYNPWSGNWVGFYRAQKSGSSQTDGTVGRMVGRTVESMRKVDQVISASPSFNAGGVTSGFIWADAGGRLHGIFPCGGSGGLGYYYSDDPQNDWATWTVGNSGNSVAAPSGTANTYDQFGTGDVTQGLHDGDVLWITYGITNLTTYTGTGGTPLRGQAMAITPARCVSPRRPGKFHLPSAYTTVTATSLLNQTTYTVMGRFRAYSTDQTSVDRIFFSEYAAFNLQIAIGIHNNNDANKGKFSFLHRTTSALMQIFSTAVVDDALWHTFECRRISTSSWELFIDGVSQSTASTAPGTDATATTKAIGNWPPARGADNPSKCTLTDVTVVTGYSASAAEVAAWIANRTALGGGTVVFDQASNGTTGENGDVALVEGA